MSEWSEWFVYQVGGAPLGPLSTRVIVDAMLAGKLPLDVFVAAPGSMRWLRATEVPVIVRLFDGAPTRRQLVTEPLLAVAPSASVAPPQDGSPRSASPEDLPPNDPTTPDLSPISPSMFGVEVKRGPDGFPLPPPSWAEPMSSDVGIESVEPSTEPSGRKA